MVIPRLFAVLLVGVAQIASAEPKQEPDPERTSYTEPRPTIPIVPIGEWFLVATPTPAKHGREFITIDPKNARLGRLRLAVSKGRVEVWSVRIDFTDGTRQMIRLDRMIKKGRPALVELRGAKTIRQIVVTTDRAGTGAYTVEAVAAERPSVGV